MIFPSFLLGNIASLSMRIINSVVVVGLYYGFLTTFSIGPSYILLFRAHIKVIEEGEKEIEKEVAAATGLIIGQLLMFVSIYYTPLHLALGRPHTITFLGISHLFLLYFWYNSEDFDRRKKSTRKHFMRNPSIQCIYLINLIYQLLNHFFFPSSMLARLVHIFMFRYNNKILFLTSSFVGWLIGHILLMKWVKFVLVWIKKNYLVRANRYILSNEYLFRVFLFYRDIISDLRIYMTRFSSILVFFICLCTLGRMPSFVSYKITPKILEKKKVKLQKTYQKKKKGFMAKYLFPYLLKLLKQACSTNILTSLKDISKLQILREKPKIPLWIAKPRTSVSGDTYISKLEILRERPKIPGTGIDKSLLVSILFDYDRWSRPMRYIRNPRFEHAVRNETSQFYFSTCENDGQQRISFSYLPCLAIFRQMIQRKISFSTTEKFFYDELYKDWIYTNEQRKKSLSNEFSNRIAVLDKKGLEDINVLENKIRLCNDENNNEYLVQIYDPFISGAYRGLIKKLIVPCTRLIMEMTLIIPRTRPTTVILNGREIPKINPPIENAIWINKIQNLLIKDFNYNESKQKRDRKESRSEESERVLSFIQDCFTEKIGISKRALGIKEIGKKIPRWPYKLIDQAEQLYKEQKDGVIVETDLCEIPSKRTTILYTEETKKEEETRPIVLKRYTPGRQLGDLIKGSMRAQKRKTSTWSVWQTHEHSILFLNRTDSLLNGLVHIWYVIKGIFLKYMRKISEFELSAYYPSFADLFFSADFFLCIQEPEEPEDEMDAGIDAGINDIDDQVRDGEAIWEDILHGHVIRCVFLVIQSILRKKIILPFLIIVKNIGRILLWQPPEFLEDFTELDKELHLKCTYNGLPFSENAFPETWKDDGVQIKVVNPFRLKPWHRSRPRPSDRDGKKSFYLTTMGLRTQTPYGPPQAPKLGSFFKPILKKLHKKIKKLRKNLAKKEWIIFMKKLLFNLFIKNRLKKRLSKNLSNVNPNLELELRDKSSEIKKENDSMINNQMIHESSIEAQFMNFTNYSLTQKRLKDVANARSTIRNHMDQFLNFVNISPNKTHYGINRLDSLQNIVQILKRRTVRLIRKSDFFIEFVMEKIYVDIFLYILNVSRIYIQKFFFESTKNNLDKSIYNNETNKNPIQFIFTIKKSHFLFSSLLSSKIKKNSRSHSDLSFLSQAYVFYKLSQAQLINLYKLRSVFKYYGTSLFLKNEIKDYFGAQGIIHSELRTKKLPNSGMNQWKNWLKSNYQYGLSKRKWSQLVSQKWRKKINEYCRGKKKKKKWNSYEKEQLINSNYQNAKALLLLLPDKKANLKKNYKSEVLSYKFIFNEDKKDSYSYRIPFQENKKKEFSYTNNYNIHKGNLIDMWRSIPITYYLNIMDIEKNTDRKYFDWKKIHFGLRKKGRIGAWIHISTSSNKNTKIEPKNYQNVDEFNIFDEIIDEKEILIDKKERKECCDYNTEIFCKKIYKKISQKINESHKKKNLFDWMGMNEEILSRPVSIECWFFPEFVLLYNIYKKKPWTIPIKLLFSSREDLIPITYFYSPTYDDKKLVVEREFKPYVRKKFEGKKRLYMNEDFFSIQQKLFCFQMDWDTFLDDEDALSNIDLIILMLKLKQQKKRKRFFISFIKKGVFNMDIMIHTKKIPVSELLKRGILTIELIRLSSIDWQFIRYQTIGISWVHKSKKHQNNQKISRDKNNYDLLIPENILSPRRRRELRILICFNSRNNKGVDKNPVYCNGNGVNKGSQFFDKSKDLDRDKKKLIKFFLWPNYRLEDLACMNRYWFDTNNGSRFSILRIRMYPR